MRNIILNSIRFCLLALIIVGCSEDDPSSILSGGTKSIIRGQVIDALTRMPLAGVSISSTPATKTIVTDSVGKFSIADLDSGTYVVHATSSGYFNANISTDLEQGENVQLVIPMVAGNESDDDLVAFYPFNNNAEDESGHDHDGTIYGAQFTTDRFNTPAKALAFDGDTSRVIVPHSTELNFGTSVDFTLGAWIKFSSSQLDFAGIFSKMVSGLDAPFKGYQLVIRHVGNQNVAGAQVETSIARNDITSEDDITDGEWHYMTLVVYRSAQLAYLYVDGNLKLRYVSTSFQGSLDNSEPLRIGMDRNSVRPFKGSIDDIRIYRRALTPTEVQALARQ